MNDSKESIRDFRVDDQFSSYEGFFDHAWATRLTQLVDGSPYATPANNLCANWKGASIARRMPWLVVTCMLTALRSFSKSSLHTPLKAFRALAAELRSSESSTRIHFSLQQRDLLVRLLENSEERVLNSMQDFDPFPSSEKCWSDMLTFQEFTWGLWKSEETTFVSIYFAYEHFLTQLVGTKLGANNYSWRNLSKFKDDFELAFGSQALTHFPDQKPISCARLARHSIVHNGGRETEDLKKCGHNFAVESGHISIMAADTSNLYHDLKVRVISLVECAIRNSQRIEETP